MSKVKIEKEIEVPVVHANVPKVLTHLEELEALHAQLIKFAIFDRSNLEVLIAKARAAL